MFCCVAVKTRGCRESSWLFAVRHANKHKTCNCPLYPCSSVCLGTWGSHSQCDNRVCSTHAAAVMGLHAKSRGGGEDIKMQTMTKDNIYVGTHSSTERPRLQLFNVQRKDDDLTETLHLSSRCSRRTQLQLSLANMSVKHSSHENNMVAGRGNSVVSNSSQLFLSIFWKILLLFFFNFESRKLLWRQYKLVQEDLGRRDRRGSLVTTWFLCLWWEGAKRN